MAQPASDQQRPPSTLSLRALTKPRDIGGFAPPPGLSAVPLFVPQAQAVFATFVFSLWRPQSVTYSLGPMISLTSNREALETRRCGV